VLACVVLTLKQPSMGIASAVIGRHWKMNQSANLHANTFRLAFNEFSQSTLHSKRRLSGTNYSFTAVNP